MVKRALLVGINYNETQNLKLRGCINDALQMQSMLIDAYDYDKSNIVLLRDDSFERNRDYRPTRSNIVNHLKQLISKSNKDDELWIHYSGHGTYIADRNGDELDSKDECLVPSDVYSNGLITDDELFDILQHSTCKVMLTIDCCHSGTMFDLNYKFMLNGTRIGRQTLRKRLRNTNIYMYSGSRDFEPAMDSVNYEEVMSMGAFTEALIKCLRFNHHNVSMFKLYYDINKYLQSMRFDQRCVFTSSNPLPFLSIEKSNDFKNSKKTLLQTTHVKNNMRQRNKRNFNMKFS